VLLKRSIKESHILHFREHVEMVKAIKGTNLKLFDMNECDDLDATVDGGDVLYTGLGSNNSVMCYFE